MDEVLRYRGRSVSKADVDFIRKLIARESTTPDLGEASARDHAPAVGPYSNQYLSGFFCRLGATA